MWDYSIFQSCCLTIRSENRYFPNFTSLGLAPYFLYGRPGRTEFTAEYSEALRDELSFVSIGVVVQHVVLTFEVKMIVYNVKQDLNWKEADLFVKA